MRTIGTRTQPVKLSNAEQILSAAIARVNPLKMILDCMRLDETVLLISTATQTYSVDLAEFERVIVLGAGKAGAPMVRGLELVLGDLISEGVVAVKLAECVGDEVSASGGAPGRVWLVEAGHPVPDADSLRAGREVAQLAERADEKTLCIAVISGGGSALLALPACHGSLQLELEDLQETTRLLLGAGTPIGEINCVRKHLSGISGGNLCRMLAPATMVALILSDVVGDELESIASGLAAPDATTYTDAYRICERYGIDGPTDAAGAWATPGLAERASREDIAAALASNDAYRFFDALGGLLTTGPTNTNVCDVQVLLVE